MNRNGLRKRCQAGLVGSGCQFRKICHVWFTRLYGFDEQVRETSDTRMPPLLPSAGRYVDVWCPRLPAVLAVGLKDCDEVHFEAEESET